MKHDFDTRPYSLNVRLAIAISGMLMFMVALLTPFLLSHQQEANLVNDPWTCHVIRFSQPMYVYVFQASSPKKTLRATKGIFCQYKYTGTSATETFILEDHSHFTVPSADSVLVSKTPVNFGTEQPIRRS